MTTNSMDLQVEQADVLQNMMAQVDMSAAYRDQSVPEGALLGETELQGQQVRWKKQKSMVRAGATPLPERFEAFDRAGNSSMLPTAQMGRMLSKMRSDAPSERAFHTHTRGMTRESCPICPAPRTPIAESCDFCFERTGGKLAKKFYSESEAYAHKTRLHPEEFANLERMIDRAERAAQIEAQMRVADAMLAMAQSQSSNKQRSN